MHVSGCFEQKWEGFVKNVILWNNVCGRFYVQIHRHHLPPRCLGSPRCLCPAVESVGWVDKLLGQTPVHGLIFQSVAQMVKMGKANNREDYFLEMAHCGTKSPPPLPTLTPCCIVCLYIPTSSLHVGPSVIHWSTVTAMWFFFLHFMSTHENNHHLTLVLFSVWGEVGKTIHRPEKYDGIYTPKNQKSSREQAVSSWWSICLIIHKEK